ncbi:MAG: metallophosphoesterase [Deltaproteobacteria bacterium]|nr:metallophosphoesterase [Deltaproteobacteria bacterium]
MRVLVFFSVMTAIWVFAHYYVGRRLLVAWHAPPKRKKRAKIVLWSLAPLSPLTLVAGRSLEGVDALRPVLWAGYVYMGFFFLVFGFIVIRDVLFILGRLGRRVLRKDPDMERRRFLTNATNAGALGAASVVTGWGLAEAVRAVEVTEVDVPIEGLPPALDGYRIAQISDVHIGPLLKKPFLDGVVSTVNDLDADMVAVTGDLIDGTVEQLREHVAPLGDLRGRDGVFFCTGNHEYYWDAPAWIEHVRSLGLEPLINEHRLIEKDGAKVLVAGCTDYRADRILADHATDPAGAKDGADDHDVSILLAHQPKSIHAAAAAGYTLQLSGHTHAGQFFPVSLFVGLAHPFSEGLGKQDDTWIYVNRGTGWWGPPSRAGVPAEITLLRLVRA